MSDLLQQLSSFLNLSKLVAITVPGMVTTLALILFFSPTPCKKDPGTCWFCQGEQDGTTKSKAALARPVGTYYVSKLTWKQANQSYNQLSHSFPADPKRLDSCANVPQYIVTSSRLRADKEIDKNLGDLDFVDAGQLLSSLDACAAALTATQNELSKLEAAQPNAIAAANARLTTVSGALANARAAVNPALARSLEGQVRLAQDKVDAENKKDAELKTAAALAGSLLAQVQTSKTSVATDASTAIPVDPPQVKSTWETIAQKIAGSVLLFLLSSMVVGQLLDPIQRSLISFDPIRGLTFPYLNMLYRSANAMGTIRFGDQRYQRTRSQDVDALLAQDHHLLEPSYAIGKGLLTQAEYSALQDQYYSQSQISAGLILPLALLAAVGFFRLLCCKIVVLTTTFDYIAPFIWMVLAFLLFCGILFLILLRSKEFSRFRDQKNRLREEAGESERFNKDLRASLHKKEEMLFELERQTRFDRQDRERQLGVNEKQRQMKERLLRDDEDRQLAETKEFTVRAALERQILVQRDQRALREMEATIGREREERSVREGEDKRIRDLRSEVRREIAADKQEAAEKASKVAGKERRARETDEGRHRASMSIFAFGPILVAGFLGGFTWLAEACMHSWWLATISIGLPAVELFCYMTGVDRLHNFISEVQSRIVGAAKKQQDSQIQKFADVLSDPDPKNDFIAQLKLRRTQINDVLGPLTGEKP